MLSNIPLPVEIREVIDEWELRQSKEQQQPVGGQNNDQRNDQRNDQDNDRRDDQGKLRNAKAWWKQQLAGEFPAWDLKGRRNSFGNDDEGQHNVEIIQKIKSPHHKHCEKKTQ